MKSLTGGVEGGEKGSGEGKRVLDCLSVTEKGAGPLTSQLFHGNLHDLVPVPG